jgi:hypothetical protein
VGSSCLPQRASKAGRVGARRAPLDRHQPHRVLPYLLDDPSSSRRTSRLPTALRTPTAFESTTLASKADRTRRQLPPQAAALSTRSERSNVGQRCVPLPRLCPLLWLSLASSLAALRYACSLGLLLGGVRLLTGPHTGEGWGREGERRSGEPSCPGASTLEAATP